MAISVAVFCGASVPLGDQYLKLAEEVGTAIAQRGWSLVSGGEHVSMMGAVAAAARAGGAQTVGIVSKSLLHRADLAAGRLIVTDDISARKTLMTSQADAFIALPGGVGTCDEFFSVWTERVVGQHNKPLVLLDPDGYFRSLLSWLENARMHGFISDCSMAAIQYVSTVASALDACAGTHVRTDTTSQGTSSTPCGRLGACGTPIDKSCRSGSRCATLGGDPLCS